MLSTIHQRNILEMFQKEKSISLDDLNKFDKNGGKI